MLAIFYNYLLILNKLGVPQSVHGHVYISKYFFYLSTSTRHFSATKLSPHPISSVAKNNHSQKNFFKKFLTLNKVIHIFKNPNKKNLFTHYHFSCFRCII